MKKTILIVLFLISPFVSHADEWEFSLTPYIWLPNIDGTLITDVPGIGDGVKVGPNDYLEALDMTVMVTGDVRKGPWSVVADLVYLDFSKEKSRDILNNVTKSSLSGYQLNLAGGYTLFEKPGHLVDILIGARLFSIDVDISGGSIGSWSKERDILDGIIGIKGKYTLNKHWTIPYYLDVGTGDSDLTWQSMFGIGYQFRWGELIAAYRHLAYDQGGRKLLQDFSFSGPAVGATFHF